LLQRGGGRWIGVLIAPHTEFSIVLVSHLGGLGGGGCNLGGLGGGGGGR